MAKKKTKQEKKQRKSSSSKTRTERDSMGHMTVPGDALHGASTQRAVLNFPISVKVFIENETNGFQEFDVAVNGPGVDFKLSGQALN